MPEKDILHGTTQSQTLGLLLVDGFALMSYASVIEPYRAANLIAGRALYRWTHISIDGTPGVASNGAMIVANVAVGTPLACDAVFVFAGGDPAEFDDERTFAWLRHLAATGAIIIGISGGPYLLARAGLLEGYRATIHWEHRAAFAEAFPGTTLEYGVYTIDRRRMTCAGGMAGADLATELIEHDHGPALAAQVSDWLIRSEPRSAERPQRMDLRHRYGTRNERVLKALAIMEANLEEPVTPGLLAGRAAVTQRQLARLFREHLGETIGESYMRIRLAKADQLLRTTTLSATAVALRCGFKSSSHFSRSYHSRFGRPPTFDRRR
jgi:transcriptional regulator GlxA family with amidase domain